MSLLDEIKLNKLDEVKKRKEKVSLTELRDKTDTSIKPVSLKESIDEARRKYGFGIIGEIKTKSPSMGNMKEENVDDALEVYNNSPVISGISVLTDYKYFGQNLNVLKSKKNKTHKPVLRKDFIVDAYQVWEAKANKADAILLMSTLHSDNPEKFNELYKLARSINLEVLIEFGMDQEPNKNFIPDDADLIGINSRGFVSGKLKLNYKLGSLIGKDMSVNREMHDEFYDRLISIAGDQKTVIAESGIKEPKETASLAAVGYSGALIGTAFLKMET